MKKLAIAISVACCLILAVSPCAFSWGGDGGSHSAGNYFSNVNTVQDQGGAQFFDVSRRSSLSSQESGQLQMTEITAVGAGSTYVDNYQQWGQDLDLGRFGGEMSQFGSQSSEISVRGSRRR